MKDHQDIRAHLLTILAEMDTRLDKITDDVKHSEQPLEKDFSEQAVETENDEVLDALGNATRKEVETIKLAISRIDAGTYGACSYCGQAIKPERLKALPYANLCLECATQNEQKGLNLSL